MLYMWTQHPPPQTSALPEGRPLTLPRIRRARNRCQRKIEQISRYTDYRLPTMAGSVMVENFGYRLHSARYRHRHRNVGNRTEATPLLSIVKCYLLKRWDCKCLIQVLIFSHWSNGLLNASFGSIDWDVDYTTRENLAILSVHPCSPFLTLCTDKILLISLSSVCYVSYISFGSSGRDRIR